MNLDKVPESYIEQNAFLVMLLDALSAGTHVTVHEVKTIQSTNYLKFALFNLITNTIQLF